MKKLAEHTMKLFELQKCPLCGMMRCDHAQISSNDVCPICHHHPCECTDEQEEVEYQGNKVMVGKHKDDSDTRFDPDELSMGIEDEIKHTNDDKRVAKNIAKDHLIQMPNYYSRQRQSHNSLKEWLANDNSNLRETTEWDNNVVTLKYLNKVQKARTLEFLAYLNVSNKNHSLSGSPFTALSWNSGSMLSWFDASPSLISSSSSQQDKDKCQLKFDRMIKAKKAFEDAGGRYSNSYLKI